MSIQEGSAVYLAIWFVLDFGVIAAIYTQTDLNAAWYEYLTNQVWLTAFFVKIFFVVVRSNVSMPEDKMCHLKWWVVASFIAVGCAQAGVLITFFALTQQDDTLISDFVHAGVAVADVMIWNHLRHVTVCFLHLLVYISERRYISRVANECIGESWNSDERLFALFVVAVGAPMLMGLVHVVLFDDKRIYKFTDPMVGVRCMIFYGLSVVVSGVYFIYGPVRTTYNDTKTPSQLGLVIAWELKEINDQKKESGDEVNK